MCWHIQQGIVWDDFLADLRRVPSNKKKCSSFLKFILLTAYMCVLDLLERWEKNGTLQIVNRQNNHEKKERLFWLLFQFD